MRRRNREHDRRVRRRRADAAAARRRSRSERLRACSADAARSRGGRPSRFGHARLALRAAHAVAPGRGAASCRACEAASAVLARTVDAPVALAGRTLDRRAGRSRTLRARPVCEPARARCCGRRHPRHRNGPRQLPRGRRCTIASRARRAATTTTATRQLRRASSCCAWSSRPIRSKARCPRRTCARRSRADWRGRCPHVEIRARPMADGGEGTLDAVLAAVGSAGRREHARVAGAGGDAGRRGLRTRPAGPRRHRGDRSRAGRRHHRSGRDARAGQRALDARARRARQAPARRQACAASWSAWAAAAPTTAAAGSCPRSASR